jgi:hypothetical protein
MLRRALAHRPRSSPNHGWWWLNKLVHGHHGDLSDESDAASCVALVWRVRQHFARMTRPGTTPDPGPNSVPADDYFDGTGLPSV